MRDMKAIVASRLFDGTRFHEGVALVVDGGKVAGLVPVEQLPEGIAPVDLGEAMLVPGFVDLQVNGGGGVLFNEQPTADGIAAICAAHAPYGTTSMLVTLITDTADVRDRAIIAGRQALEAGTAGFLGLHLEGPHLSLARKGTHDPQLICTMEQDDLDALLACAHVFPAIMTTIAPENVTTEQVRELVGAGYIVSLGHTDCAYETAIAYIHAGASCATHLFNAMSGLGHREPGMVGAVLTCGLLNSGLIADGFHVDPVSISVALKAKQGPGKIFIVTDAMSSVGSDLTSMTLNGRTIFRRDGRLTLADGTLAGADIDMISSVRFLVSKLQLSLDEALRMASLYPAEAAGVSASKGRLADKMDADFVVLDKDLGVLSTWIGGEIVYRAD
jgi:N-acetylglucosamine-6-phosphate deacetylase